MKRAPQKKPGKEFSVTLFDEGEIIHEHAQPGDLTPSHLDMVLISQPNHKESVIDKQTFQVWDDIYEEDLPKPHIQYTPHQVKHLQLTDPSFALI